MARRSVMSRVTIAKPMMLPSSLLIVSRMARAQNLLPSWRMRHPRFAAALAARAQSIGPVQVLPASGHLR
jgi:hypothetical protein